ncbi:tryptophan--tRNA ligase [Kangiella geojedonensis]|uniref:Tryptophan--tRNA ligase n=1 Tax=Kangiella geojedonensis TaxID=914150 RepID=A0A0F6TRE4_9GAMM|nr:tryptophan--tRNA ligase [Kangiella geojedonensis]AKE52394.1 tryptophanyl-tRNA synthetase [Kangiella geojedonensis]
MSSISVGQKRVLSGMRPTGPLHLGHYHGVLKNWAQMQHEYECFFMVADWHALTTNYDDTSKIEGYVWDTVIDWLAAGINPSSSTIFVQSKVPEHAELHLLMSMTTPLGWLERVPTYKEQQEKLQNKDLSTYGFLGYPLLQAADILVYKAGNVPVGADQVPHVEMTREAARRFNHFYGKEPGFEEKVTQAIKKMGKKNAKLYNSLRKKFQEEGDQSSLETAQALVESQANISLNDRERLYGYLDGAGKVILPEPKALLTPVSKMPGLDGQKMSKSYGNAISMREPRESVEKKIRTMPTDPARVRRDDPGNPEKCPVWEFHKIYSPEEVKEWVQKGCTSAGIGCVECKQPVIDSVCAEQQQFVERAQEYEESPEIIRNIVSEGCDRARDIARETMDDVRQAMGLSYK